MGEYRWNNLAHVIDAIGMSSTEMSRFLETRGIKRSPRTIRRWSQVGVVAYHDDTWKVKYIVEAVWKAIDNYAGTETLPDGLPQRIVDRCHTIAAMREDEADRDQSRKWLENSGREYTDTQRRAEWVWVSP